MSTDQQLETIATDITVHPEALLITAPAATPIDALNSELHAYGLHLPIAPLVVGCTLAEVIASNDGGRRALRYGTVVRYLRGAVVQQGGVRLVLGGPTMKRATGYALHRALVNDALGLVGELIEVTLNLRPLPPMRRALLVRCSDIASAYELAQRLVAAHLSLSALAFATDRDGAVLLVELEGIPAVVERQTATVQQHAANATVDVDATHPWQPWEALAADWRPDDTAALRLVVPRSQMALFTAHAQAVLQRYRLGATLWGDAGVGTLHLRCTTAAGEPLSGVARGEAEQAIAVLQEPRTTNREPRTDNIPLRARGPREASESVCIPQLRAVVGDDYVLTRREDIGTYLRDASIAVASGQPLAVVLPANTAQTSAVLQIGATFNLPIVTRGAGSGLAGGSTPSVGALVLALTRLDAIAIDADQMIARVGAGAVTADVQQAAEALGLFYPPDPSSLKASTIGGNIACNAGGPRCLKYGVTADYVLGLTAVLADGNIVELGDGLAGQSADTGDVHLLIGSEGTLAVLTEATLRLLPRPVAQRTTRAMFASLADACATVEAIMAAGLLPAGLELMDDTTIAAVEAYLHLGLPADAGAMLLMLADGEPEAVEAEATALAAMAQRGGALSVQVAQNAEEEAALWQARRSVAPALARIRPNRLGEDICVPLPQIAHCVRQVKQIAAQYDQPIVVFGHAGDGNLHPNILFDGSDPVQVERVWHAAEAIFQLALDLGGTLSGEHGIGTLKRPFMVHALGEDVIDLEHQIKAGYDPDGRLNPGKVLP